MGLDGLCRGLKLAVQIRRFPPLFFQSHSSSPSSSSSSCPQPVGILRTPSLDLSRPPVASVHIVDGPFEIESGREEMGVHCHCWTTCYSLGSHIFLRPSDLRFRGLNKASDCNSSSSSSSSRRRRRRRRITITGSLRVGVEDIAQIVHNKVLIAAAASAAIGQLSKPFTSEFLYGKGFDLRAAAQPGGFPSTHSSAVVAAATSLALERGFSDSIFGLAVVYAAIVMYDAQGVRMEVGKHAQVMNRVLMKNTIERNIRYGNGKSVVTSSCSTEQMVREEAVGGSYNSRPALAPTPPPPRQDGLEEKETQEEAVGAGRVVITPFKETVGHTKVEVMAGALLGFLAGLVVHASDVV